MDRVEEGNFGAHESVGDGVFELKEYYGPGYRVYYGLIDSTTVLLLCGGDKSTQKQDIKRAKAYWADYQDDQEEE